MSDGFIGADDGGPGVWVVVNDRGDGEKEVEIFGSRPQTSVVTGDGCESNWPSEYEIYEGNINGGDSRLIEYKDSTGVWIRVDGRPEWMRGETVKYLRS